MCIRDRDAPKGLDSRKSYSLKTQNEGLHDLDTPGIAGSACKQHPLGRAQVGCRIHGDLQAVPLAVWNQAESGVQVWDLHE